MAEGVELRLLGPLTITGPDGAVIIRDGLPRKLLAALAIDGGAPASADVLIELLWPEQAPNDARNALQVLVSYLRRQLDPVAPGLAIERGSGGYRLVVDEGTVVDIARFEAGVGAVPEVVDGRSTEELLGLLADLEAALDLWRGPPYVDAAYDDFAQAEIVRLTELRARGEEQRAALLMALGRCGDAAGALQRHLAENPLRESAWGLLMLALYRGGRQAEALRAFTSVQEHLVEELGIDPGPELRDLERRILDQDPSLDWVPGAGATAAATVASTVPRAVETRVPQPLSSLVGRVFEIEEVERVLGERRLVTLVGPAGVGKTRLAVEVAQAVSHDQTVLFVELGSLLDPDGVPTRLAAEVGAPTVPDEDPLEAVLARLGAHPLLLVLDTCEHVLDAVAAAASILLRRNAGLRILATSRQPLGIEGEVAWTVPTLELADDGASSLIDVEPSGAVRLFVDRARAARPDFVLTDDNAADVARICRVLDGLPLAISLAAARVNVLSPAGIVDRLHDRFKLLSKGGRDAERRQQSLRSAVEWSYELLDEDAQRCFCRLGVFPASFDVDAATAVAGEGLEDEVFDHLGDLVDRSLVVAADGDRFRLLDTLRAFAADQLAAGEHRDRIEAVRDRHADWYLGVALEADPKAHGPLPGQAPRLRAEMPQIEAALDWLFSGDRGADGARLAGAVAGFLVLEGRMLDAGHWLQRAIEVEADDLAMATVHRGLGIIDMYQIRYPESREACIRSVELARRTGDDELVAGCLLSLGTTDWGVGDLDAAIAHHQEAAALFEALGDDRGRGFALSRLGRSLAAAGRADALEHLELAERLLAEVNGEWMHSVVLEQLAAHLLDAGRTDDALARVRHARQVAEDVGSLSGELAALITMSRVLLARGEQGEAAQAAAGALARAVGMGNPGGTADALDALARVAEADAPEIGAELLGCAAAVREQSRVTMVPAAAEARVALVERYRERLGGERLADLLSAGRNREPSWGLDALELAPGA